MAIKCYIKLQTRNFDMWSVRLKGDSYDQLRLPPPHPRLLHLRPRRRLRRKAPTYRRGRLRAELPSGHGVCGQMDVFRGRLSGAAL